MSIASNYEIQKDTDFYIRELQRDNRKIKEDLNNLREIIINIQRQNEENNQILNQEAIEGGISREKLEEIKKENEDITALIKVLKSNEKASVKTSHKVQKAVVGIIVIAVIAAGVVSSILLT